MLSTSCFVGANGPNSLRRGSKPAILTGPAARFQRPSLHRWLPDTTFPKRSAEPSASLQRRFEAILGWDRAQARWITTLYFESSGASVDADLGCSGRIKDVSPGRRSF